MSDAGRRSSKKWYYKNKDYVQQKVKERKQKIKLYINQYKEANPCKCGECTPCCLDFHHKDNDRNGDLTISQIVNIGWSLKRIKKELEKCIVLCANCHRKLHFKLLMENKND